MKLYIFVHFIHTGIGVDVEFVFAIPRAWYHGSEPRIMISTTAEQRVNTTISMPGITFQGSYSIDKNNGANIALPDTSYMKPGDGKQNKTVIIRASDFVYVYALENKWSHSDAFQAIPASQLGTKYYVASYRPHPHHSSFICVSAIHADTSVSISNLSGHVHNITLQQFESYRYDEGYSDDLSGTLVQSDKSIAVVSGTVPHIPEEKCCPDAILEMLYPVQNYGKTFYAFPFLSVLSGFVYRVFASHLSTTLYMPGGNVTLDPGEYHEVDITQDIGVYIEADQPIMVAQYMKSNYANNPPGGDPSMLIVPSVLSYTNNVTFPVFEYSGYHKYYINVAIKCDDVAGLLFDDGISMASWDNVTTDSMCCVRGEVSTGFHSVSHSNPRVTFSVSVYALVSGSSYFYLAGSAQHSGKYP